MREAARRECWAARFCLRVFALRHASLGHVEPEPPLFHRMAFALLRSPRPAQTPAWDSCTPSQFFRASVVHDMVAYCNELEIPCTSTAMSKDVVNFVSRAGGFNDDGVALLKLHEHEINGSLGLNAFTLSAFHELNVTIEILP